MPLTEGVLQVNLGVPIVVVCTKADLIWNVSPNREMCEKTLDFVLKSLREFCLTCKLLFRWSEPCLYFSNGGD